MTIFRRSIPKTLAMLVIAVLLTLGSAMLAFQAYQTGDLWSGSGLAGAAGVVIFGLCSVIALGELFRISPVIEVTAFGIRDRRLSPDLMPWIGISDVSVLTGGSNPCVTLRLRPEVRAKLKPPRIPLLAAKANDRSGLDVSISMRLLNGSLDDLVKAIDKARPVDVRTR